MKAEANLLRFPFFALHTKGLRNCKGWSIEGKTTLDDASYDFKYRITCNTDDVFPGPLAREAHHALMHILTTTQSPPYDNPIGFTWRQLRKAMGKSIGGADIKRLKAAIRSIHGTRIRSTYALKNAERGCLKSRERGFGLYSEYVFLDEMMPDKSVADMNYVWLADWFVANLNSFYSTELDFQLWQRLHRHSPIASRLFEFLTFNFTGDWDTFRINYKKLALFLPVMPKRHLSQAKEQLEPAIKLLIGEGVLSRVSWERSRQGEIQINFARGASLRPARSARATNANDAIDSVEIKQLYKTQPAAQGLVKEFYSLWTGNNDGFVSSRESRLASEIIDRHGRALAEELLREVVSLMKAQWPDAKAFGATRRFWSAAKEKLEKRQRLAEVKKKEFVETEVQKMTRDAEQSELEKFRPAFEALSNTRKEAIERIVLKSQPRSLTKFPKMFDRFCLREFAEGQKAANG